MNTAGQIEAILLASDEPVSLKKLRNLFADELSSSDILSALSELESHYQQRGIQIVQAGGGWQFRTAPEHAELVHQLWEIRPQRLSRSALETLAIIAYRQPTTRAEIEALRGFKVSSSIIATLQERGWIKVLGRKEVPGRPHLFGTGKAFLMDFGLNSLQDLPDSAQLMDEDEIQNLVGDNVRQIQQGVLYETEQSSENSDDQESPQQGEVGSEAEETSP
jgi:segregation and condensation protein B